MGPPWNVDHDSAGECSTDALIAELAGGQHGRVKHAQLVAAGIGRGAIDHRVATGRLITVHRGVYAVGHNARSLRADWMAAVLAGGDGAVLSHLHGATLRGMIAFAPAIIDVTVPRKRRSRAGVRLHRDRIADDERARLDGIPVTSAVRTLRDIAPLLERDAFERAWDRADVQLRHDPLTLRQELQRYPHHPGSARIAAILKDRAQGRTRSWLERRFKPLIKGLPKPLRNHPIQLRDRRIEADCYWPRHHLIVELDGRSYHDRSAAFETDKSRDRAALVAGLHTVRLTWRQIRDEPDRIRADLEQLLVAAATA